MDGSHLDDHDASRESLPEYGLKHLSPDDTIAIVRSGARYSGALVFKVLSVTQGDGDLLYTFVTPNYNPLKSRVPHIGDDDLHPVSFPLPAQSPILVDTEALVNHHGSVPFRISHRVLAGAVQNPSRVAGHSELHSESDGFSHADMHVTVEVTRHSTRSQSTPSLPLSPPRVNSGLRGFLADLGF